MKLFATIGKFLEKYWLGTILLAGVIFYCLVMVISTGQPVWFDEGYSILLARQDVGELLALTAVDAHPPFYYLLLKLWASIFGFGEFALRSFGAVLMSGAVMTAAIVIRRLFSTRVALIALPFIILAPFLLRYAYEIRMYALSTLIAISATYALIRARDQKGWAWWAVYAALVALGMYTLYLMVAVWLAHFVWLLVTSIKSKQRPFWRWQWLYAFAGAVVLFAAYIPTFLHQLLHSALPGMGNEMTVSQLTNIVSTLALYKPEWALGGWGTIVVVALVTTLVVAGVSVYRGLATSKKQGFMLLVALSFVPIAFYAITSLPPRDPIYIVRYMAHSAIFLSMLAGVIVALFIVQNAKTKRGRTRSWLLAGGVLFVLISGVTTLQSTGNFVFERSQKPLTHQVRDVARCDNKGTVVVADDPYTFIDSAYYFQECDPRFFSEKDIDYKGGYAMLHGSQQRVGSQSDITSPTVVHLGWKGQDPLFALDQRYRLVTQDTFDKQVVTRYELIAE